jgi:hypothetical protein
MDHLRCYISETAQLTNLTRAVTYQVPGITPWTESLIHYSTRKNYHVFMGTEDSTPCSQKHWTYPVSVKSNLHLHNRLIQVIFQ